MPYTLELIRVTAIHNIHVTLAMKLPGSYIEKFSQTGEPEMTARWATKNFYNLL